MTSESDARRLALALPEAVELDHHGFPSFRVRGHIFASMPQPDQLRVMSDEHAIRSAAAAFPLVCKEVYWGKRLAAVQIDLPAAEPELVEELLVEAWQYRQSK